MNYLDSKRINFDDIFNLSYIALDMSFSLFFLTIIIVEQLVACVLLSILNVLISRWNQLVIKENQKFVITQ